MFTTLTNFRRAPHLFGIIVLMFMVLGQGHAQNFGQSAESDSLVNAGHNLVKQGERQKAFETFFSALSRYDKSSQPEDYFNVLVSLSFHLFYSDTFGEFYPLEERLGYIDEAMAMAIELEQDSVYANKVYHKGVLYNISQLTDSSLYYFDKTIELTRALGNDNILLQAYYYKSRILKGKGDLDASLALLLEYEREAHRLQSGMHIQTALEALGAFYLVEGDVDKMIAYYKKGIEAAKEYSLDAYYSLSSLATSYMDIDSIALARQYLKAAGEEIERVKREDPMVQDYDFKKMTHTRTLGYFYAKNLQEYDSALVYLKNGLAMARNMDYKEGIADTRENLARVYEEQGNHQQALAARLDNYELVKSINRIDLRLQIEENLAGNYEALGQYDQALLHFRLSKTLNDSLMNVQQLEAVSRLETEFETEKKEQQIVLLNEQNQRQQARQTGLIIIGALLLLILALVFIALKSKQKANRLINQQKDALSTQNEKLIELSEFKENLTHMIVHDMKNPLNSVIGLSMGEASPHKLSTINQSGHQMLSMVTNMLDVQRFEEAKVSLNPKTHRFNDLLNEAVVHLELLMHAKGITLKRAVPAGLHVEVDGELIIRVLGNLLANALKFSPQNKSIKINSTVPDSAGLITIAITDYGQGITPDEVTQVFDKYWHGNEHMGSSPSTGLGLTFCKLAVEAHGGKIGVESEYGVYTRFSFTVPGIIDTSLATEEVAAPIDREESLILESDFEVLTKYIPELIQLKVHQVGRINSIIRELDKEDVQSPWKNNLVNAMHQGNQVRFDELVEMLR